MQIEERLKVLEEEFSTVKLELQQVLLDIRGYIMDSFNPLGGISGRRGRDEGSGAGGPNG
ncbi:MAG: hypothetical protein HYX96_02490 [Chloroflexi bacterium]|nr:hypothetical protein [Chloroflexota bacterium]